jgi:putative membrane protein
MHLLAEWILKSLTLLITAYLVPGFHIDSYFTALIVAVVLGILNLLLKPILVILTLPVTIITLGLFMFVINALLLLLTSSFIKGFRIDSFGSAILASIVITLVSSVLNHLIK